jgi:hypothetical protein
MALDEPERNIQVGGLPKPFRVIKKAPKGLKDLGRRITTTLKATKKKKPVVKYTKKVSLIERIRILKEKAAAKKKALATKVQGAVKKVISSVSVAAKQAAKKVATSTRRVVSSIDTKTKYAKAKINTLKKVAMAKAVKIASALRTRLLQSSASSRNTAITKLKTKLLYIRNLRNNKILGSKRGAAGDIMGNNSLNHGISGISFVNSFRRIGDSNLRRKNASDNIGPLNGPKSVLSGDVTRQTTNRVTISDGLGAIGIRRDRAKGDAREASTKAETARVDAAANLSGINTNKANRNTIAASIQPIMNQKAKRQNDAADAKRVADSSDGMRRSAGDTAVRRQQDRAANDSARRNAGIDATNHSSSINSATARKNTNQNNLAGIQTTHQSSINSMNTNADNAVSNINGRLNTVGASKNKQIQDEAAVRQSRNGKQAEASQNSTNISNKNGEVAAAKTRENNADNARKAAASNLATKNTELGTQVAARPGLKTYRDSAAGTAEAAKPVRPSSYVTNINRKTAINGVEIPNRISKKTTAASKRGLDISDLNSPTGPMNRRRANDDEMSTIANERGARITKDTLTNGRRDTANSSLLQTKARRDAVALDIKTKQDVKQARLQHADQIKNRIDSLSATTINRVSSAQVNAAVSSKRLGSSTQGRAQSAIHGTTVPLLGGLVKRVGDLNTGRKNASDNIGALNGRKSVLSGDVTRQTTNRLTISDSLSATGIRRDRAKGDAKSASTKAETARVDAAALNLSDINTKKANRNTIAASIDSIVNRKAKRQSDAADAKKVADSSDGMRRSAGDTAVRRQQDRGSNDSGRKNAAVDSQTHSRNIDAAGGRKATKDADLADIQTTHQSSMRRLETDADGAVLGTKKSLDDVGSSRNKLSGDADTAAQARRRVEADSAANTRATKQKEGDLASSMSAERNAKSRNNADAEVVKRNKDELDQELGREPITRSDRNSALNNAEASKPVRSRDTDTFMSRKNAINDVEIPNKRAVRNTVAGKLGDMNIDMNGPGGTRNRRAAGDAELQAVSNNKVGLANKDGSLRNKLDTEKLNIDRAKVQKKRFDDNIDLSTKKRTERGQVLDGVENRIAAKRLQESSVVKRTDTASTNNNITRTKSIASEGMTLGGKNHASSVGPFVASKKRVSDKSKDANGIADNNGKLNKKRGELSDSIDMEGGNNLSHNNRKKAIKEQKSQMESDAQKASKSAGDERIKGDTTAANIDIKKRQRASMESEIANTRSGIDGKKNRARDAGIDAENHRRAADSSVNTSKQRARDRDSLGDSLGNESVRKSKLAKDISDARQRKSAADSDLQNAQTTHRNNMDAMDADTNGAVNRHKKAFDDTVDAPGKRKQAADDATTKRLNEERKGSNNKDSINNKKKEVDTASGNENSAKKRNDDDMADIDTQRKKLTEERGKKPGFEDDRRRAMDNAEQKRPMRKDGDAALAGRKKQLDDNMVPEKKKKKQDAEDAKKRAEDDLAAKRAQKEKIPPRDDPSKLYENDAKLKDRKKKNGDYNDDLKKRKSDMDADLLERKKVNRKRMDYSDKIYGLLQIFMNNLTNAPPMNPAVFIGPGIQTPGFEYPGISNGTGVSGPTSIGNKLVTQIPGTTIGPSSDVVIGPPINTALLGAAAAVVVGTAAAALFLKGPTGPGSSDTAYDRGYKQGMINGNQDGQRDGTADAQNALLNVVTDSEEMVLDQLKKLNSGNTDEINKKVAETKDNAYCKEIQIQGVKQGIDIFTVYPECVEYFRKNPIDIPKSTAQKTSGPRPKGAPGAAAEGASGEASGAAEGASGEASGAAEGASGEASGAAEGASTSIQTEATALKPSSVEASGASAEASGASAEASGASAEASGASAEASGATVEQSGGYREDENGIMQFGGAVGVGTVEPSEPYDLGYSNGYRAAYRSAYTRAYSLTKAIHTTSAKGEFEAAVKAVVSGPRSETDSTSPTENNTGPSNEESGAQEGGSLRRAKRVYRRGKTLTQHGRLLKRIVNKTISE